MVLEKTRHGDEEVQVSVPQVEQFKNHTPVLVDDIISTARTMIETVNHLKNAGMKPATCIGVHAVFAGNTKRTYRGRPDGKKLVLTSPAEKDGYSYRITITRLNDKRTLVLHERRRGRTGQFFRVAGIGYTRKGTSLAAGGSRLAGVLHAMVSAGARVILVGASPRALEGLPVERRAWQAGREGRDIAEFDVGIMPLADTPWERGKCAYKIVQYMAAARAVVASPVGANAVVVEDGAELALADDADAWRSALIRLRDDHALRDRLAAAGRRKVEGQYSLQVQAPRIASVLRGAALGSPASEAGP